VYGLARARAGGVLEDQMDCTYHEIAKMIERSLLDPTLTDQQLNEGCRLPLEHDVTSVCILPRYLRRSAQLLGSSAVRPSTTIGFPRAGHATAQGEAT